MKELRKIQFDLEDSGDRDCAFFALYAGLRMYEEYKDRQHAGKGTFSIAGAEAYCLLQDLKEQYYIQYKQVEQEYNEVYLHSINGLPLTEANIKNDLFE